MSTGATATPSNPAGRTGDGSNHHCHAINCTTHCRPELLMCLQHWKMVPFDVQAHVYATYRRGQCDDMEPSLRWVDAAKAAIRAVAEKEGVDEGRIVAEMMSWDRFAETLKGVQTSGRGVRQP